MLTVSSNATLVKRGFDTWRSALVEGATRAGSLWQLPEQRIVFRSQDELKSEKLGQRTSLGNDPTGAYWAVQINEANKPGDVNVTSAIAIDKHARAFLIRQGRLISSVRGSSPILETEFRQLTGLTPVVVKDGNTVGKKREWYIVTALDVGNDAIRNATGRFVDQCALARDRGIGVDRMLPDTTPIDGFANDETGGVYTIIGRDAQGSKEVRRLQGEVWQCLALRLREAGITIDKPKHALGYEVDAVVAGPGRPLLIEIKSGTSAAEIYGGMGQLQLYPKLLPKLGDHQLVLLLPALPQPALIHAVEQCGVRLCTYQLFDTNADLKIIFHETFLALCGLN